MAGIIKIDPRITMRLKLISERLMASPGKVTALAAAILLVQGGGSSQQRPAPPLVAGELLEYEVSWSNFLVAGQLRMQVKGRSDAHGADAYHLSAHVGSVGPVRTFFKLDGDYDAFVDPSTLRPFRAEKRTLRGKRYQESHFTIGRGVATLSDGRSIEVPPDTYDLASLFYAIRAMDLRSTGPRLFTLLEEGKLYKVRAQIVGRQKVITRTGNHDAVKVLLNLDQEEDDSYKLMLYITNDSRRLPVLLLADLPWGQVRVELLLATAGGKDLLRRSSIE